MKKILTILLLFVLCACKTQSTLHYPQSTIIRDSISITYKQGTLPIPQGITLQEPINKRNNENPNQPSSARASPVHTNPIVRVDTVFVERWHTQYLPEPAKPIPRFYKDCTWGFFILLLLMLGRIALRILKAVRL